MKIIRTFGWTERALGELRKGKFVPEEETIVSTP